MSRVVLAAVVLAALGGAVHAQSASESGRYAMTPVEGGFLRLDTRSGEVSMCRAAGESVQCRAGAHERSAFESEIDRLAKENAELKARLAGQPPAAAPTSRAREEIDRALDYAERFIQRMMRILREEAPPDRT